MNVKLNTSKLCVIVYFTTYSQSALEWGTHKNNNNNRHIIEKCYNRRLIEKDRHTIVWPFAPKSSCGLKKEKKQQQHQEPICCVYAVVVWLP